MQFLLIYLVILWLSLTLAIEDYYDYIDDISTEEATTEITVPKIKLSFYKPGPRPTRKPKPFFKTTTEMCMKFLLKRKAAEEAENPTKNYKPSGNRWHGPVGYGKNLFKQRSFKGRTPTMRDITPTERKLHKCYKWIKLRGQSEEVQFYTWPAVLQTNPVENLTLIEICCPQFGPVRLFGNTVCHPYCRTCYNGNCVAPEVCDCHDGFILSDNKDCVFTCPISCLNGHCNLLNRSCFCNDGYKPDETGLFCRPICKTGCMNPMHNCTSPDVCSFRNTEPNLR